MLVKSAAKVAVLLVLTLAGLILAIRTQSRPIDPTLAFILPQGDCPAPCFIGIRPGRTSISAAMRILLDHRHARSIDYTVAEPLLIWYWRGLEISAFTDDNPVFSRVDEFGIIQQINLTTALTFGEMWLILSDAGRLPENRRHAARTGLILDAEHGIVFYRTQACRGYAPYYWQTLAGVWIGRPPYPLAAPQVCA